MFILKPFRSIISLLLEKHFDDKIIFLHSLVTEEICAVAPITKIFSILFNLSPNGAKEQLKQQLNFSIANVFVSGGEIQEWKTGFKVNWQQKNS